MQLVFPTFSIYDPFATDVNFTTCWCNRPQASISGTGSEPHHKEEGKKRRELDVDDRRRITLELSNMLHPLTNQSPHLYNIGFAPPPPEAEINVADSVNIGEIMASEFNVSLPTGFYTTISNTSRQWSTQRKV